jgi:DNA-binding MarR family transcriptional regulator
LAIALEIENNAHKVHNSLKEFEMKNIYLRFLSLANAIEGASTPLSQVDETAKQLLEVIALHHAQGKALTVTDAMAMASIASPATLHRKLDDLREQGLIAQIFEGKNRRTKYLVPTKVADKYFANLGKVMAQAIVAS